MIRTIRVTVTVRIIIVIKTIATTFTFPVWVQKLRNHLNIAPKTPVICLITLYHCCFPSCQICEEVPQVGDHGVHLAGQLKIPYQLAEPELAVVDKWSLMLDE